MDYIDKTPEEFANEYFLVTEEKLVAYAKNYPNKPLAYVFYNYVLNKHHSFNGWSPNKFQNFLSRFYWETGALEVRFNDDSIFVLVNGFIYVFHAKTGYFYTNSAS